MKTNPLESQVVRMLEDMLGDVEDYIPQTEDERKALSYALNDQFSRIHETARRILEEAAQDLKDILNRTKTERGLSTAVANYVKTLTAKEEQS